MDEKRYWIGARLMTRTIDAFSAVTVAFHRFGRFLGLRGFRQIADEADAVKEELKRHQREQDGLE